jgi:hypothetical protein
MDLKLANRLALVLGTAAAAEEPVRPCASMVVWLKALSDKLPADQACTQTQAGR